MAMESNRGSQNRGRRALRLVVVDIAPLRANPRFRWLYFGQLGGALSRQILVVAVPYEVYVRTESTLLVGMVGMVQVVPLVLFSFVGGVIADAFDRRRVLVTVEALMALCALMLAWNASSSLIWPIFVLISIDAALHGIEAPSKSAVIPALVGDDELTGAFAIQQSLNQVIAVVGPAGAGLLIAASGIEVSYLVATVLATTSAVLLIPIGACRSSLATGQVSMKAALEGWTFLRRVPLLQQVLVIDLSAMAFGTPRALFPAMGTVTLGGSAATVGMLYAAPGVGALVAALTAGWVTRVRRQGRLVVLSVAVYGLALIVFGLSRYLWLTLLMLALAGAADVISTIFRNTIVLARVPDHLRGRVTAFKGALSGGGPRLGDAVAGAAAAATSPTIAIVSGGLLTSAIALGLAKPSKAIWVQTDEFGR